MKKIFAIIAIIVATALQTMAQAPAATLNAPASAKPGDIIAVTLSIKKCDLSCYAQYQQLLPEGLTATEISGHSDNANFYFENNKVIYQWYKLPVNKGNITLKYNIRISEGMKPGKYQLPGYFSYQVNNRLGEIATTTSIEIK